MNVLNWIVAVFATILLLACGGEVEAPLASSETSRVRILAASSNPVMQVQLPFYDGQRYRCTQNSNDTPTHQNVATRYDLDFGMPAGSIVVAAAGGTMRIYPNDRENGGFGWFAKVDHHNGYWTIYAHLSGFIATEGQEVVAGQPIAYSGGKNGAPGAGTSTAQHLHFGVHSGGDANQSEPMSVYARDYSVGQTDWYSTEGSGSAFFCDESASNQNGHIYESRPIGAVFSDYQCRELSNAAGVLCWQRQQTSDASCEDGFNHVWYRKNDEGARLSERAAAQKCLELTSQSTSVLAYLEGGYGVGGVGPGAATEATDPPTTDPPDYIGKRVTIRTPWGVEVYKYGLAETMIIRGDFENIGSGSAPGNVSVKVHFYLSRGYKEDSHSDWIRVGEEIIQSDNLRPGEEKTEFETVIIRDEVPGPGIWNIVACIDHPQNENNNGGDVREKHESNNCTTEAVFEVTANQIENVQTVDFTAHTFGFLQAPTYAGDFARFTGAITNQGTAGSPLGIRSSYSVSCNGGPEQYLTDDGTDQEQLGPGMTQTEETVSAVLMPNVVGTCTAYFRADYQGAVTESDETNNVASFTFMLAARPAPNLYATTFRDDRGCCTTNTGNYIDPRIWVYNAGPAAPSGPVRIVYHISSPVATGGSYILMNNGTLRPDELLPGMTGHDGMDNQRWQIPRTSAWKKQWHTIRACLKPDGSIPVGGGPGELCYYYQRYSRD